MNPDHTTVVVTRTVGPETFTTNFDSRLASRGDIITEVALALRSAEPVGEVINGERCTVHGAIARYSETCGQCEDEK